MTNEEIRELTDAELMRAISDKRDEITRLRLTNAISPIEDPKAIRKNKRIVARMLTEVNRRKHSARATENAGK